MKRIHLALPCLALLVSQTGCITLSSLMGRKYEPGIDTSLLAAQGYSIPPGGWASPLPDNVQPGPADCVVEIRSGSKKQMATVPIHPEKGLSVEELAKHGKLDDSLGKANICILRPTAGGPPIRLDSKLNSKGKCADPGRNYGLRPGDHVIVTDDGRSMFERFLDEQLGRS
jgi:hypothetical protein